jgi:hypothetical protein
MTKMDSASKSYMGDLASSTHAMGGAVGHEGNGGGSSGGEGGGICDDLINCRSVLHHHNKIYVK